MGNKFSSTTFKVCPPSRLSFDITPCFRKWDMFIKGKTALVTGAATGIGLEYVKALLQNGAQVSYIGWSQYHVRALVETRLHSQDSLRGSRCYVDKQSCYLLRKYVNKAWKTTFVHGSNIHFRTSIANCSNISHSHLITRYFIFRHKQIINVFKNVCKVWRHMAVWHKWV